MIPYSWFEYIALNPKMATFQIIAVGAVGVIGVWIGFYLELKKQKEGGNGKR